jgi:O-antigen/teichoic acid export membrane protein
VAISGGIWTGIQVVLNKFLSLGGTVGMMYLLEPTDFGVAALASSVIAVATLLPAFTLSDVLISRPDCMERQLVPARWMCFAVTVGTIVAALGAAPWVASAYGEPRLLAACTVVAARPLVDWMLLAPQTRLRARLAFREMASVDALTQALATALGLAMAWFGLGFTSILVPQIVFTAVRAWIYSRVLRRLPAIAPLPDCGTMSHAQLWNSYVLSGLGQYVHAGLFVATPLLIGHFANETDVGLYSNAFNLSASINVIVAVSMGLVLQPIFAQMGDDRERQAIAFLRACRVIAAVSMPICMMQAALAPAGFDLFLPAHWAGSIVMTQVLCVGQMFYFPVNPAMGLLKAQGRFGAFFAWQTIQLLLSVTAMVAVGRIWPDHAAVLIVVTAAITPLLSSPIGVWLSVRGRASPIAGVASVFATPFAASLLSLLPGWLLCRMLVPAGASRSVAELVVVPLLGIPGYLVALRAVSPDVHAELRDVLARLRRRSL